MSNPTVASSWLPRNLSHKTKSRTATPLLIGARPSKQARTTPSLSIFGKAGCSRSGLSGRAVLVRVFRTRGPYLGARGLRVVTSSSVPRRSVLCFSIQWSPAHRSSSVCPSLSLVSSQVSGTLRLWVIAYPRWALTRSLRPVARIAATFKPDILPLLCECFRLEPAIPFPAFSRLRPQPEDLVNIHGHLSPVCPGTIIRQPVSSNAQTPAHPSSTSLPTRPVLRPPWTQPVLYPHFDLPHSPSRLSHPSISSLYPCPLHSRC